MADTTRPELLARVKAYLAQAVADQAATGCPDLGAWEEFFYLYNGILTRFAGKLGFRPGEIDELLQQVWLDVVRLMGQFVYDPSRGGFRRWLYRIMRSKAADIGRQRQRRGEPVLLDPQSEAWKGLADTAGADPLQVVHQRFMAEVVQLAVERFQAAERPEDWQVFDRCKLQGQASPEVAAALGLSPEAARKRLQRGLARFRQTLTQIIGEVGSEEDWL